MQSFPLGILWATFLGWSQADHMVTVQPGPLFRTVGSHITIWCKVSGYHGTSDQTFEVTVRLLSAPEKDINVMSSNDPDFSYSKYRQRVITRDIYMDRISRDHIVLHMVHLREEDTGEYECYTPNTVSTYQGTYNDKTNLTVIPNTLQVSMPPQTLEILEGASLELTCQVSMASSQHTHLSVSWSLSTDQDTEILTLSRDFVLHPGGAFSGRFTAGDVRMDKLSETSYKLTIRALHQSDQGEIFCRGSEWIQDPNGEWIKITEKDSEKTSVKVVAVQGEDLEIQVETSAAVLTPGRPLEVTCSITNRSPSDGQFRIVWLLDGTMMAAWEMSGVSTFRRELGSAGEEGRLGMYRRDLISWVLRINQVRIEDGGSYVCEVTDETNKKSQRSRVTSVEVKQPEFRTSQVSLTADTSRAHEGDLVAFRCLVSDWSSSSFSLGWFRRATSGDWMHIVSVMQDGQLVIGADYRQRHDEVHLLAEKVDSGLFMLRLGDVTQSDGGEYVCRYSEGTQGYNGDWKNVTTDSNGVQIDIQRLDSSLQVSLMTRHSKSILGNTAVLYCKAKADFSLRARRLVWSWSFQSDSEQKGPFQSLVQGPGNGELVWGESYPDFKGRTQISFTSNTSILQIHRVQRLRQSGAYRCSLTILTAHGGVTTAAVSSNVVTIKVQLPDMKLRLDSASHALTLTPGQDEAVITCRILERTPSTNLSVVWFYHPPSSVSPNEIIRLDREGVTSPDPSLHPRFISGHSPADSFFLRILRPGLMEVGAFYCTVQEWLPEETGNWVQLGERNSAVTQITFSASDRTLRLPKQNVVSSIRQGEDLVLRCSLGAEPFPTSLLSISWFQQGWDLRPPRLLYRSNQDGVTESKDSRLHMEVPGRGNYSLVLQRAGSEDSGRYFCQVEEWRLQDGEWKMAASEQSGALEVSVTLPEDHLTLNGSELTLLVLEHSVLTLPCQVVALSLPSSLLSVSWWKAGGPGAPHSPLFSVNHTGEFIYPRGKRDRLQYERPSELSFHLRIQGSHMTDSGTYHCRVQEWLPSPRGVWEPIGERQSGNISVTVQTAGFPSPICTSPPIFNFLLALTVLFLILLLTLIAVGLWRWRSRGARRGGGGAPGGLWASVKMFEVKEDGERMDDQMTPPPPPITSADEGIM